MYHISFRRLRICLVLLLAAALLSGCSSMEEKRDKYIADGKQLYEKADYNRARVQFKNALQIDPKSAVAYLWLGKTQLKRKKIRAAFGDLNKAVELKPDLIEAQVMLGRIYLLAHRLDEAKVKVDLILEKEPENIDGLLLEASLAAVQKQPQKALDLLKKIIAKDPHKTSAYLLQASIEAKDHPDAAAASLEAGIKANPKNQGLYLARATLADKQKQYDQAKKALLKAIELDPKNIKLQLLLAQHYFRAGQWDKVEATLRRVMKMEPAKEDHVKDLVRFLLKRGRLKDAEQTLKDYVAQHPDNAKAPFLLVDYYLTIRQYGKGIKILQEIIDKNPHGPTGIEAKDRLAALRLAAGRIKEAEQLINEVLKDNPKDMEALSLQGQIALIHRDGLKAVTNFRQLTHDRPKDPRAWLLLAQANLVNKEPEQAKEMAKKALGIKPDFLPARRFLYGLFIKAKDYDGAIQAIKGYLNYNDKDVNNLSALGDVYVLKHDYAQAQTAYQKIVTLEPKNPLGYYKLGLLSRLQKKPDQALKYMEQALKHQPKFIPALQQEAGIYLQQKQPEKALGAVQGWLARTPNNPRMQQLLGELYLSQKQFREAIGPLEKALAGNPNPNTLRLLAFAYLKLPNREQVTQQLAEQITDPKTPGFNFLILSSLYEQQHQYDKAKTLYETMIQRNLFANLARNNLAYLLAEHDPTPANLEKAEKLAGESLQDNPDEPSFQDTMGWVLCKRGEFARAKSILEKAAEKATNNPTVLYHLGWCAAKSKDPAQAREFLEKALALKKEFSDQAAAKKLLQTLPPAKKP